MTEIFFCGPGKIFAKALCQEVSGVTNVTKDLYNVSGIVKDYMFFRLCLLAITHNTYSVDHSLVRD